MGWRQVIEEFEADLYRVPQPRFFRSEKGELERKRYDDGEDRLKVSFRDVDVPDGAAASVLIDGQEVCRVPVRGGRGRLELSSGSGHIVPPVKDGQVAEVCFQGRTLLRGTFDPD